jgi:predicted NACHT family NTPase
MQSLRAHIEDQDSAYRFIVTTRSLGDDPHCFDQFRRYRLLPFRPEQIKEWAKARFASRTNASPDEAERFLAMLTHTEVVQVPLLLAMAADLYESDRARQLPTRRAALYEKYVGDRLEKDKSLGEKRKFLRGQCEDRDGEEAIRWADAVINARRKLLEHLAFWQQGGGAGALADETANYWVSHKVVPSDVDRQWLCELAETVLLGTGLLTRSTGEITFAHHTFAEYLAASAVANSSKPDDDAAQDLVGRWLDSGWREVVFLLLGYGLRMAPT